MYFIGVLSINFSLNNFKSSIMHLKKKWTYLKSEEKKEHGSLVNVLEYKPLGFNMLLLISDIYS